MLTSLFHAGSFSLESVLLALGCALALGILIAVVYRLTSLYAGSFVIILAILPFLVASVILIVNGNLGASVAVLGAFGLVRFRSAPGTAMEIGFLFFAMAVGLAAGMGFLSLALLLTAVGVLMLLLLSKTGFGERAAREKQLRITIPEDLSYTGLFDDLFLKYTRSHTMEKLRTTNMGTMYDLYYRIVMRDPAAEKEFVDALRCRNGNLTISLGLVEKSKNVL